MRAPNPAQLHELRGVGRRTDRPDHFPAGRPDMAAIDAEWRLYSGLAAYCDEQIGRLLRFLDDAGLRDNTLEEADGRLFGWRADHRAVRDELLAGLLGWRGDLIDVQALQEGMSGGGPIAAFAAAHTRGLTGLDAERRLGDRLASLDAHTA